MDCPDTIQRFSNGNKLNEAFPFVESLLIAIMRMVRQNLLMMMTTLMKADHQINKQQMTRTMMTTSWINSSQELK